MKILTAKMLTEFMSMCDDGVSVVPRVASTPGIFSPKFRGYEFPHASRRTAFRSLRLSFPADGMPGFFLRGRCFAVDVDL